MTSLARLRALEQQATPGPWVAERAPEKISNFGRQYITLRSEAAGLAEHESGIKIGGYEQANCPWTLRIWPNTQLAAALRNAAPALLDVAEAADGIIGCPDCGGIGYEMLIVNQHTSEAIDWEPIYERDECGCRTALAAALARLRDDE